MNKVKTGWKLPLLPLPICLLGAHVDGKPNFNTIIWFNMIHDNPPLIGIAMRRTHYTNKGVKQNQCFSINIPTSDMVVVADYCGLHSGSKIDKSKEFDLFYGELKKAPMIVQCCLNIECKLVNTIQLKHNDLFIGEIVEIYSDEKYVKNKRPNAKDFDTFICLMPNGPYFKMGDYLAEAYEVGTSYKPK
ncbi:MAG: flavin reductase family protein [Candidatus Thorarchaeota archaeon]